MKLVLAEKPSVAQSIAKVLGAAKREDGYLEGNGYVVSWCVGHLVELAQPEVYDAKYSKWAYVHGGVVFQLADEHDAEDGGGNVDGAEVPLQALHSGGFVQVPNQQNSAACSLRYLSQPHEGTSHLES